jgi:curli biogenesis system outer membrane secretion channel CsgG
MKRIIYMLVVLAGLAGCAPLQVPPTLTMEKETLTARRWNVAVLDLNYEFEEPGVIGATHYQSAGKDGGKVVAGELAANLAKLPKVTVIDRENLDKVLAEAALQQTGVVDAASAREVGKLAGADAVVTGDLTDYVIWDALGSTGSTVSFNVRMIDTKTGKVLVNASISRARPLVDSFTNVQLTCKELYNAIVTY